MKKRTFYFLILLITFFGLVTHLFILKGNNLYFTVDQGRDAVYAREIIQNQRIFLRGPETSVRGIFTGPLWFYFVALGYLFSNGHPIGPIALLVILNLSVALLIAYFLSKKINRPTALIIALLLQIYWPFFKTSLWSFNPFPLIALCFALVFLLTQALTQKSKQKQFFALALLPIFFAANTQLSGAMAFSIFYLSVLIWKFKKQLLPVFFLFIVTSRPFFLNFKNLAFNSQGSGLQVFEGTNFELLTAEFLKIFSQTVFPFSLELGAGLFFLVPIFYYWKKDENKFRKNFVFLTFLLTFTSYLFFASNAGWRDWHTFYLSPLIFCSLILMLLSFPKKASFIPLLIIALLQIGNFAQEYRHYLTRSEDPGLLYNQLIIIEKIYQQSENQGFAVYNYTDTFYDYPYQYLFYWQGLKKHEYLPCEYSNYPLSPKETYVPGYQNYLEPKRGCDRIKFLIIQSETNGEDNTDWPDKFQKHHALIEKTETGKVKIEKYYRNIDAPTDFCLWWDKCD